MKNFKYSLFTIIISLCSAFTINVKAQVNKFELPKLNYSYSALEPYIDEQTMNIHYNKHHLAYVNNLNKAIVGTEAENMSLEEILNNVSKFSETIRNNAGGHWNHTFFWNIMTDKKENKLISLNLKNIISNQFGSFENFQQKFEEAGNKRFGSGWVWLIKKSDNTLEVISTPNQDNPLMDISQTKGKPILGCDVWEHAYYLKYQNRRADYLKSFWNVINWKKVEENYNFK
ncbi:MAG: superoxide dismutase [Candidatus Sericytochromatia bacterium]|nr:MAG: superoxide dismutase [Candidatus Sericytochromatia bacterium]